MNPDHQVPQPPGVKEMPNGDVQAGRAGLKMGRLTLREDLGHKGSPPTLSLDESMASRGPKFT